MPGMVRCTPRSHAPKPPMTDVLTAIVRAYGQDLDFESSLKIRRYLRTLSQAGRADSHELTAYGLAYLRELESPDRRYSGC
jgi:hypothetical protein